MPVTMLIKYGTVDFTSSATSWRESDPKRVNPVSNMLMHGAKIQGEATYEPRMVQIQIQVQGSTVEEARTNMDNIVGAFPTGENNLYKHSDRYLKAHYKGHTEIAPAEGSAGLVWDVTLSFIAGDPFYYPEAGSTTATNANLTPSPQSVSITNSGTEVIFPKLSITANGGTITSISVRNNTLSPTRTFDYVVTIAAGNTLVADLPNFRITNS